jgi:hypothetical protein
MKIHLKILIIIFIIFNKNVNAQQNEDTIYFWLPELNVNNSSFLMDLDILILQSNPTCEGEDTSIDFVYIITIKQIREYVYLLRIEKQVRKSLENVQISKGFFKLKDTFFFVKGRLPKNPKELFNITNNKQQFYYTKPILLQNEITIKTGRSCMALLEYKYQKLNFIKTYLDWDREWNSIEEWIE